MFRASASARQVGGGRLGGPRSRLAGAIAAWPLAALAAGCGGGSSSDTPTTRTVATRPDPAAAASAAQIVIAKPADGTRLRAREQGGLLRVRAKLSGGARAGTTVHLSASCQPRRCKARAKAGTAGRWNVPMTLTTTLAARFVTVDARAAADEAAPVSAVTTVELSRAGPAGARGTAGARARPRPSRRAQVTTRTRRAATIPAPRSLPHDVLVIGDSLAVGMEDAMRAALPGWRVRTDARIGRPLAEGMRILAARRAPAIIALSLFTNDDPGNTAALARAVRATASRPGGCAIWATVVRPPYNGVSYAAANDVLTGLVADPKLAGSLQLVDWRGAVAQSSGYVARDGVHGTPAGYRALGRLYAGAIHACAGER